MRETANCAGAEEKHNTVSRGLIEGWVPTLADTSLNIKPLSIRVTASLAGSLDYRSSSSGLVVTSNTH